MDFIKKEELPQKVIPGRKVWTAFGVGGLFESNSMTFGYGRFSPEYGTAEPHNHSEELVYVVDCNTAYVRFGSSKNNLGEKIYLHSGETVHFQNLEWHVLGYDDTKNGFLDVVYFYPTAKNIRPEDNKK